MRWLAVFLVALALAPAVRAAEGERVRVTGEIVDTWCAVTGIMYGFDTAHHKCAVWCALGGIPVSIRDAEDNYYMILKLEGDDTSVANPRIVTIQTHEVTVDGTLFRRDSVSYLLVDAVADDRGIVDLTHDEYGIQPFGE